MPSLRGRVGRSPCVGAEQQHDRGQAAQDNGGPHHIAEDRLGDRTSRTHGTFDRPPTPPRQTRCEDSGEDERYPDHLPRPDDALCRKDPLRAKSRGHQGQPGAKPGELGSLVREFGLGVRPVLFAHRSHSAFLELVVSGGTEHGSTRR